MKKIQTFIAAFVLLFVSAFVLVPVSSVGAAEPLSTACASNQESAVCINQGKTTNSLVGPLVGTLLFVVGVVSVLMIIVGGFMYVLSQGNSASVTKAKNTVLYAIVGLVVSLLAYAIVFWVFKLF